MMMTTDHRYVITKSKMKLMLHNNAAKAVGCKGTLHTTMFLPVLLLLSSFNVVWSFTLFGPSIPKSSTTLNVAALPDLNYGLTDDEFRSWLLEEVKDVPGRQTYDTVYQDSVEAIVKWRQRYRGNPAVWKRIFKKDRVIKELIESAPIIENVKKLVEESESTEKFTVMDLCSGKGYMSMLLSEMLPSEKVERFLLVDKAWAIASKETKEGSEKTYFSTWPVPLYTSKQDLKQSCNQRQMKKHFFDKTDGNIIILAVHLCGTLSLKAVEMFNTNENVKMFALKPCCLPPMIHAQRDDIFKIGKHEFDAKEVCSNGSFNKKDWNGPPRWHLQPKFDLWADHLFKGIDMGGSESKLENDYRILFSTENGVKAKDEISIQVDGGFQNTYIFAERVPLTSSIWNEN